MVRAVASAVHPPIVLSIAGSDPSGGAGIQQDLRVFAADGLYGTAVIAGITVQSIERVIRAWPVGADRVAEQLEHLLDSAPVAAIKTGMLGDAATVAAVGRTLRGRGLPLVVDPVLRSTSGAILIDGGAEALVEHLLPLATVVTPNGDEAADLCAAAGVGDPTALLPGALVVVTGGDEAGDEVVDRLLRRGASQELRAPRIHTTRTRGTGCAFSSWIACGLARGLAPEAAARRAHDRMRAGLEGAVGVGTRGTPWFLPRS